MAATQSAAAAWAAAPWLATLAEVLEAQLRWSLFRYEVCCLESRSAREIAAALPSGGVNRLTPGDPATPWLEYGKTTVELFHSARHGPCGERRQLLSATRAEAVGLVLRFRAEDPAAAIERDMAAAARVLDMYEHAVHNADRWLTDPTHPAYPAAQARPREYAGKREAAHRTLAAHRQAMEDHRAGGLAEAPPENPEQPSLF